MPRAHISQEQEKGRAFAVFWALFQMGTIVGSAIAIGIEAHSTLPTVSTGIYLVFLIIQLTAIGTAWLILPPHLVVRSDGTVVELEDSITPAREVREFGKLFRDWKIVVILPMFFA